MNRRWRCAVYQLVLAGVVALSGCASRAPQPAQTVPSEKNQPANDILFTALDLVGTPTSMAAAAPTVASIAAA
ncbi:MAG: hypothetical protein R3E50_15590 [Halioglobus sp.]